MLLLDTHVLLAIVQQRQEGLGPLLDKAINDRAAILHVSVASLWEIAIKIGVGKLSLSVLPKNLPELVENLGMVVLAINHHHVLHELEPAPATRDPFDRLLLAQCAVENLRLVTLDRALAAHPLAWREG